jgi:chorismate mutase/prephenate dehydratase
VTLAELRQQIDAVDAQIIRLLSQRAELVHEVGVVKKASGQPIYDAEREQFVLSTLIAKARELGSLLSDESIRLIYREVIRAAHVLEREVIEEPQAS